MNRLALDRVLVFFILGLAAVLASSPAQSVERELLPPASQGEPRAQCSLGFMYYRQGYHAEAAKWWRLSAAQGWAPAQYALAESFRKGTGVPQDDAAAAAWYRRSADQGMPSAQYKLGLAYLGGVGVPKDALTSYVWLGLAVAGGEGMQAHERERAIRFRRSLESILDPLEVARGRQMMRDWKPTSEWRATPSAPPPGSIPAAIANPPAATAIPTAATVIPFTPGRPIYVDARVNGRTPVRLVLDTGADSTVIAPDALSAAGASVAGRTTLLGVTGQAAVGIHDVASLEIGNAKVGPLKVLAHHAADQAADGLLGRDFLERFTVTIDSAGGRVTLTPRPE